MFKITKRVTIIALVILTILGGLTAFYGTNLVLNSVLQKDLPFLTFFITFFPSVTFLLVSLDIVLFIFFFIRLYLHPTHEKRMLLVYGIILGSFSLLGIILNTLSGTIVYGSFLEPRPFAGYHVIMYIYHILMLGLAFLMIFYFRKKVVNDDIIIHKTTVSYVFKTILWSLIFFIALNRLGGFILSPTYIQWSTLALTYPAYVALLLPTIILVNDLIYIFNGYKKAPAMGIVISSFVVFLSAVCFAQNIIRGQSDPLFIQLVSPINPIGRLLTFPYDTVLQLVVSLGLGIYTLFNSIKFKRASDFNNLPYELRTAKAKGKKTIFLKKVEEKKETHHQIKPRIQKRNNKRR